MSVDLAPAPNVISKGLQSLINSSHTTGLPFDGDFRVDDNVLAKFPKGTEVLSASRFGTSAWTVTARLHIRLPDASEQRLFLKSAPEDHGRVLMQGEFNAMSELYKWAPELIPEPHSWANMRWKNPRHTFFSPHTLI